MTRIPRELRKQRCIMTTDSEWEAITSRAGRAGMTISQFMVRRTLDGEERQPVVAESPPVLPPGVQQRIALAMLVLARIEEQRLRDTGAAALWDRLVAEETEFLDSEDLLSRDRGNG